ncbi:alpha/beta hydrolase family protein [Arthrobacter sp. STN4]|uniref:alpha/beta hydrolase n=1 Tax=Arthrobacter sp. STN4 TaxID=2923276 RepID=UPI00211A08B6|nr:alpha/beta hydrolase-fold protein [Arthrobacter sp. STN4]MCQ9163288.1 alpha/beta hydrolase-fold protein [Arthrobacter sp. STN4]
MQLGVWIYGLSLASGFLPLAAFVLGVVALAYLLVRRSRRWWIFCALSAAVSAALGMLLCWAVIHVWYWWPEDLPATVVACVAFGIWGLVLGLATALLGLGGRRAREGQVRHGGRQVRAGTSLVRRLLGVAAGVVVLVVCAVQVNVYFGEYPTVGSLVRGDPALARGIPHFLQKKSAERFRLLPVEDGWVPPSKMLNGEFRQVTIPGKVSGFHARPAVVYLPPAYFAPRAPALPVVVLVTGQPGSPENWLVSGHLPQTMADYARAHHGLAPVVVMPDANGSQEANTMCMNSALGRADTYMAVDVPHWISATLNVDTNHEHWAVAGFSYGGTCAMEMVTRHPSVYRTFAAISAEREPALTADRAVTIQRAFHGNASAFDAVVPLTLLDHKNYPFVQGWFASGQQDQVYTHNAVVLEAAARKAGMKVERTTFPGGHSWIMVTEALPSAFAYLGARLGLQ